MRIQGLLGVLVVLIITGCRRENSPDPSACIHSTQIPGPYLPSQVTEISYNENHCGYLPLGKKNYWIYLDSIFDNTGVFQSRIIDTFRFKKTYITPDGIVWWDPVQTISSVGAGFRDRMYTTDSITYVITSGFGGTKGIKWFYAITVDSLSEDYAFTDHPTYCVAQKIPGNFSTPAGSFSNCMLFTKRWVYGPYDIASWFKPGLGVLKTKVYQNELSPSPGTLFRTSTLLQYHIE